MASNAAVAENLSDILAELGGIPVDRVHCEPTPGRATIDDLVRLNNSGSQCELVDGTLVEKAMGWRESLIALALGSILREYVTANNLGVVTGADCFIQLLGSLVRGPDVAFISWARLPDGQIPQDAIPQIVPDLAVEVISVGNTLTEMSRKRREYFHAGVRLVWMVDPRERTVAVYTSINDYEILDEDQVLRGHDVVPGLEIQLAEVFAELDRQRPQG
jgi:Uma2 family endonuclease